MRFSPFLVLKPNDQKLSFTELGQCILYFYYVKYQIALVKSHQNPLVVCAMVVARRAFLEHVLEEARKIVDDILTLSIACPRNRFPLQNPLRHFPRMFPC